TLIVPARAAGASSANPTNTAHHVRFMAGSLLGRVETGTTPVTNTRERGGVPRGRSSFEAARARAAHAVRCAEDAGGSGSAPGPTPLLAGLDDVHGGAAGPRPQVRHARGHPRERIAGPVARAVDDR